MVSTVYKVAVLVLFFASPTWAGPASLEILERQMKLHYEMGRYPEVLRIARKVDQMVAKLHGPGGLWSRDLFVEENPASTAMPDALENPLLRSGLVLAGANRAGREGAGENGEDGIVTALEVSGLYLLGTDLVVLSACETGVGDVRRGEAALRAR